MLIAPPTSADSHPVNTPSTAFQTAGGALLLALTSYACLHVQSSSFLCMSSLEVLSSLHFFMVLVFPPCALTLRSPLICFLFYLTFGKSPSPPPSSTLFLVTVCTQQVRSASSLHILSKRELSGEGGRSAAGQAPITREKLKAIPFIASSRPVVPGGTRAHRTDSEHWD